MIEVENPYRAGSLIGDVFEAMRDGNPHSKAGLCLHTLFVLSARDERRVTSTLRAIRRDKNGVDILYLSRPRTYMMVED